MEHQPSAKTWLAVFVGTLDAAFALTEEELYGVTAIVRRLFEVLRIPGRGQPHTLPMPVVHEMTAGTFATAIEGRTSGAPRPARLATQFDCVASLEAWREALIGMLLVAYPDIDSQERLLATKVLTDLLARIGVPNRAASCHPQMVVSKYLEIDLGAM